MPEPVNENPLRDDIYERMNEKETDELLEIYRANDIEVWTADALAIVRQILHERLGELPEPEELLSDEEMEQEEEKRKFAYPSDRRLIWIADLAHWVSWLALIVTVVYTAMRILDYSRIKFYNYPVYSHILTIAGFLDTALLGAFIFVMLQAISEIIYLLMDIRDLSIPEELDDEEATLDD